MPELMEEIHKDDPFYKKTGGGVTLSGGEPLFQEEFTRELLEELKKQGYHTNIETTGYTSREYLESISAARTHNGYFSIDKKIATLVREKGLNSIEDLIAELKSGQKALISQVIESLAFGDTHFYRDWSVFQQFENYVLPLIKETNRDIKKLRILSLGCSTGQEVYSIAIMVNKVFPYSDWQIDIIGTDLCSAAIVKAQRGIYDQFEIQNGMNAGIMIDNFTFDGSAWRVNENIKKNLCCSIGACDYCRLRRM